MKKTYIIPKVNVFNVAPQQMIASTIRTIGLGDEVQNSEYNPETLPDDFDW